MKNRKILKQINRIFTTAIIIVMLLEIMLLALPRLLGFQSFSVLTNSMKPSLQYGYLVIVKQVPFDSVQVNDIATFQSAKDKSKYFTHRIIAIDETQQNFITKGDANPIADPIAINYSQMTGKVVLAVPFAGLVTALLKSSIAGIIFIIIMIIWLALEIELLLWNKRKRSEEA